MWRSVEKVVCFSSLTALNSFPLRPPRTLRHSDALACLSRHSSMLSCGRLSTAASTCDFTHSIESG